MLARIASSKFPAICLSASLCLTACAKPPAAAPAKANTPAVPPATELTVPVEAPTEAVSAATLTSLSAAPWWNTPYPQPFDAKALKAAPSRIRVSGNKFVDELGKTRIFQGVSIADPDHLRREGQWSKRIFEEVARWGANVVRLPVHPAAWRGIGPAEYLKLLDQALVWASETGLYVIVDWHSIGNLEAEMYQHPMYNTTKTETFDFWRTIAFRYKGISTFAFYEIFNEPTTYRGTLGAMTWKEWKALNEEIIGIIYAHDEQAIPLVGGFNWAYELGPVAKEPISAQGIAYVSHPYPMKTTAPFEEHWDRDFGFAAKKYPLMTTEIGYMRAGQPGAHNPVIDDGTYGPRMTQYLAERGASWVAWVFHPSWSPQLIADWTFKPTESGEHFRKVMLERQAQEMAARAPAVALAPLPPPAPVQ